MTGELTFGKFVTAKRKEIDLQMKDLANGLALSSVYICDIEKDRRPAPAPAILERMAELLQLNLSDKTTFYDLAGRSKNSVSVDLPDYIMNKDVVRVALRLAKEIDATDEDWQRFIDELNKKKNS